MTEIDVLVKKLYDEVEYLQDSLAHGCAENFEQYRHQVGVIRGLEIAVGFIEDLVKLREQDED